MPRSPRRLKGEEVDPPPYLGPDASKLRRLQPGIVEVEKGMPIPNDNDGGVMVHGRGLRREEHAGPWSDLPGLPFRQLHDLSLPSQGNLMLQLGRGIARNDDRDGGRYAGKEPRVHVVQMLMGDDDSSRIDKRRSH
jgi:hypothetical protein